MSARQSDDIRCSPNIVRFKRGPRRNCASIRLRRGVGLLRRPPNDVSSPAPLGLVIGSELFSSAGPIVIVLAASLVMGPRAGLLAVVGWLMMVNLAAPGGPFANPV